MNWFGNKGGQANGSANLTLPSNRHYWQTWAKDSAVCVARSCITNIGVSGANKNTIERPSSLRT